jgi:hypothetical protein
MNRVVVLLMGLFFIAACKEKKAPADSRLLTDAGLLHANVDKLTEVIIYDVFSPPVSSRIYTYTSLAAYEALRFLKPGYASMAANMHGFPALPEPDKAKPHNYLLAATKAFFTVAEKVTFSVDTLKSYQQKVYADFESLLDGETYANSLAFGEAIGKAILERSAKDNYKQTRGMPKFLGSNEEGKWRPTPPDYLDAAEPHWQKIKTLVLDSASQISCPPPPAYSTRKTSPFYKSVEEVHSITTGLTEEQKKIAKYWDDNPFVIEHSGHMMFANKKITPVGHWIGITAIACKQKNADAVQTAQAYALTSVAIFDVLISCWKSKYEYQHMRPITLINDWIDPNWLPLLQTPPFPEHSSGHSGISAAAATVLTTLFGSFPFEDTSDLPYIGMKRSFQSFQHAAQEASISRVYGGIHYTTGVNAGVEQGARVGAYVISKLLPKKGA